MPEPITPPSGRLETWARGLTLLTTSLLKLAGAAIGLHEAFQPVPDSRVLIVGALLISGGTWSQGALSNAIDRLLGREPEAKK